MPTTLTRYQRPRWPGPPLPGCFAGASGGGFGGRRCAPWPSARPVACSTWAAGRGDLGLVLGERGWRVAGLEPSSDACAEASSRGVSTESGTLAESEELLGGDFDAAVFQHSLEHVAEPAADLAVARRLLRPGGLLIVTLPNFASTQARRFGSDWFHRDLPRHRTHFPPPAGSRACSSKRLLRSGACPPPRARTACP
jgi:SAM-dependent methyltransferase